MYRVGVFQFGCKILGTYTKQEMNVELIIMGLESEKRMIQATDRKLLDVHRQTQIDQEIRKM